MLCQIAQSQPAIDAYGGWSGVQGEATGFFHAQEVDGRWWLITPEGNGFLSIGVNHISFDADKIQGTQTAPYRDAVTEKYGTREAWAKASIAFLRSIGFNTVGAWSGQSVMENEMPYTVVLEITGRAKQSGEAVDVWGQRFEDVVRGVAEERCAPLRDSKLLVGYFSDNELHWAPDWRTLTTLLEEYLMLPADAPGHKKAVEFLQAKYASAADFRKGWRVKVQGWQDFDRGVQFNGFDRSRTAAADAAEFETIVAKRYFEVCNTIIKSADPNHMVMGCRVHSMLDLNVIKGARGHVDVFSLNHYFTNPDIGFLQAAHEACGAPLMITEWAFRAKDSGLPNTRGAGPVVETQAERTAKYRDYLQAVMREPFTVGAHWFEYADEPAEGRFDGENSNYGLVNIEDEPYEEFIGPVEETNRRIYQLHVGG